jgi:hypothetical protein
VDAASSCRLCDFTDITLAGETSPVMTPLSQRESMAATVIMAAMMLACMSFALASPIDDLGRLVVASATALYLAGIIASLVYQNKHSEAAYYLFRVSVPAGVAVALLGLTVSAIARHPRAWISHLK